MDAIPEQLLQYLSSASLTRFWLVVRKRLEANRLSPTGLVTVEVDADGAEKLSGLLAKDIQPGSVRVKLGDLELALQRSYSQTNLVKVASAVTGSPLTDRLQMREHRAASATELLAALKQAAGAAFTPAELQMFVDGVRRSGTLTKAGRSASVEAISRFKMGWDQLAGALILDDPDIGPNPVFGLGELASIATGTAHGFDEGKLAARLMLRALAVKLNEPVPATGEDTRRLWELAGVATDDVSGTAMTWGFCPPGNDPWAVMMRKRAGLGLVTHLTVQELRVVGAANFVEPGSVVFACENPQILSAAARAAVRAPLLCLSGQGSAAGWQVLRSLIRSEVKVLYHGDFDWPGILIASRVMASGGAPWRMGVDDYVAAARSGPVEPLEGARRATPWDEKLSWEMERTQAAVHEEAVVEILLSDLLA